MNRLVYILLLFLFTLTACTNPIKKDNIQTPMNAAKAFVRALISSNMVQLNEVVYRTQSIPTEEIMGIAKMRKITTMSPKQFSYKLDPDDQDKETIDVSFKDENGNIDMWKLVFVKNEAGNYQYDGYLSGTLLANSTPNEALKSYAELLIHSADKYWYSDFVAHRTPDKLIPNESELVGNYHLNKKSLKDFKFGKSWKSKNEVSALLQFKDHNLKVHSYICYFKVKDDGLYTKGYTEYKYTAKTASKATITFMNALYSGAVDPAQLVQPKFANQLSNIAKMRKITGMKWGYDYELVPKTTGEVHIRFKSPTGGGTDNYEFIFKKNKSGIEQFDTNASGTLLENMTPERIAQSYVNALIHNANAYQLKSLTLPSKRSSYSNKDASNLVTKYQLQNKKLSDFKITTDNNQVTIQFKDSAGTVHSIHLTTEKWKDGYYVVSHQFN